LALRFLSCVEETFAFLYQNPQAGSPREFGNPLLKGLRSWPVHDFEDIRVYYLQPDERTLRIIRVLHGKRDVASILRKDEG